MQVADRRMIASVGSRIVGSSRSSRRTSPGPGRTAPRIVIVLSVALAAEDALGNGHSGHGLGRWSIASSQRYPFGGIRHVRLVLRPYEVGGCCRLRPLVHPGFDEESSS